MSIHFTKMSALGNDFIIIDGFRYDLEQIRSSVPALCDRRNGIGADGVIFTLPSEKADYQMRIFNSDGSEPEMCGNGIRCFAHYLYIHNLFTAETLQVETLAGTMIITRINDFYRVDMGRPHFAPREIPFLGNENQLTAATTSRGTFNLFALSMGNPHAVIHTSEITDEEVLISGQELEHHPLFPKRTNVEFIRVINDHEIEMRVWERGCGETLACGTGACAAVVAGIRQKLHGNETTVHLRGGDLFITWSGNPQDSVFMTGPAELIFTGETALL